MTAASARSSATLADLVRGGLADGLDRFVAAVPVARTDEDPEGVHQARVALRRVRSVLRVFKPLLDEGWRDELNDELRRVAHELGAVRDLDVLGARLDEARMHLGDPQDRAAGRALLERMARERAEAVAVIQGELAPERLQPLLDRLTAAADAPVWRAAATPDVAAAEVAGAFVAKPWRQLRRQVRAVRADPATTRRSPEGDTALHELRIRAKRVRYAADAIEPVVGRPARRLSKRVSALQDVLGDLHDTAVAADWLRTAGLAAGTAAPALAAGQLIAVEQARGDDLRVAWAAAWKRVQAADRSWIPSSSAARATRAELAGDAGPS